MTRIIKYNDPDIPSNGDIYIERLDNKDFMAYLYLRGVGYIDGRDPVKRHRNTREALISLKKEIKDEIQWLKDRLKLIEGKL